MRKSGKRARKGGHDFVLVDAAELPFSENYPEGAKVLLPDRPRDDHLEFPADAELEDAYFWVGSGLAAYRIQRAESNVRLEERTGVGFSAADIELFDELDWHGECFQVLSAHGWLGRSGGLSTEIVEKVREKFGDEEIQRAKESFGENWETYIGERAAIFLTKPLSRLWYAANMMSLYYAHYDDLRLGYLWAEYRIRMRHEADSLRGKKNVVSAASGGTERAKAFKGRRSDILDAMSQLVENGKTVSNAARLTHAAGHGTSAEANRKLWYRHFGK